MSLGSSVTRGPFGAASWIGSIVRRMDWLAASGMLLLMLSGIGMAWINARSYDQELLSLSSIFLRSIIYAPWAAHVCNHHCNQLALDSHVCMAALRGESTAADCNVDLRSRLGGKLPRNRHLRDRYPVK